MKIQGLNAGINIALPQTQKIEAAPSPDAQIRLSHFSGESGVLIYRGAACRAHDQAFFLSFRFAAHPDLV